MRTSFISLILLLLLGACNRPEVTERLAHAERIMNAHPDSALQLLRAIDAPHQLRGKDRADYALLFTQAQHKNYIDEKNDSLINIAVDYYADRSNSNKKFLSYFYKGIIHYNASQYITALHALTEAEALTNSFKNDYYIGLMYAQMGYIYYEYYDYPKSIEVFKLANKHFQKANKIQHQVYSMFSQSRSYRCMFLYEKSDSLYHLTLAEAQKINYKTVIDECIKDLILLNVEHGYMDKADSLYQIWNSQRDLQRIPSIDLAHFSRIHLYNNDVLQAEKYMKLAWRQAKTSNDSINLYHVESQNYLKMGKYLDAYQSLHSCTHLQNKQILQKMQKPVLIGKQEYLSDELLYQKYKLKWQQARFAFFILLSLFGFTIIFYFWRKKTHQRDAKIEQCTDIISELQKIVEDKNNQKNQLVHLLFLGRFEYLNALSDTFKLYSKEDNHQQLTKDVYKKIEGFIEELSNNPQTFKKIEDSINCCHNDMLQHVKSELKLSDKVYRQMCYHIVGFSVNAISLFMKESTDTIYKRRRRFRETIINSTLAQKEELLQLLS